jgi:hypothetical protein
MSRRVFVHVGLPKAGSTFLQTTMWQNRRPLRAQGFLYPGSKRMDHYHASQVIRGARPEKLGENAAAWDRLRGELNAWDGDGLLSHEFLSMATPRQAADLVAALDGEVHVVVVLRDYVRQFPAVWQEALKMNTDLSVDDYMDQVLAHEVRGAWGWRSQDVPRVLRRWSRAVPAERVHVITVPPPGAPRHLLWERWTEVLGIDTTDFDMDTARPNESLGAPQAALMQRLKPHLTGPLLEGPERHRWVRAYFAHEVLVPQRGPRLGLRDDHREALEAASGRAIRAVRRGGYPVAGELADLRPVHEPGLTRPDDVPDAELVEVAAQAIERMVRDVRELTLAREAAPTRAPRRRSPARRLARRARRAVARRVRR